MPTMTRRAAAVTVGLLLGFAAGVPATPLAEVVTRHSLPTDGLVLVQPCTAERLDFSGPVTVEAHTTPGRQGADVRLIVRMEGVLAKGQLTGTAYRSRDILNTSVRVDALPGAAQAAVNAAFWGGATHFHGLVTLPVTVDRDAGVDVALGNLSLSCR